MTLTSDNPRQTATPDAPVFAPLERLHHRGGVRRWVRRIFWLLALLVVAVLIVPRGTTRYVAHDDVIQQASEMPKLEPGEHRVAIVLGAGLRDRRPSPVLRDRIDAALTLLDDGRVDMLLMSGDNSTQYHDEPSAMRRFALEEGAPVRRVAVDYAGRRTWDSCVRAKEQFGIDHAVVVTNAFHVDRAVMMCQAAGIDTTGMSVDDSGYGRSARAQWRTRELLATGRALVDAWWLKPKPAVGGDPINPYEPCELFHSLAPSVKDEAAADFRQFNCR